MISIDTLRRDHLAPYGARFDTSAATRLAREGAVFEHAVSQVPLTLPSHTSLFTGLYPPRHAIRDNGFVLEPGRDHARRAFSRQRLCDGRVRLVVRAALALGHRARTSRSTTTRSIIAAWNIAVSIDVERPATAVVDAAVTWLKQPKRGSSPFYLWVHLYDPHDPYTPPEAFRRAAPSAYAGEVIYADHEVSRLLDTLDALDLRRNTLIVYLADHGESLGEHGEPTHGVFLYGDTLDVPLIVAPPSGRRCPR